MSIPYKAKMPNEDCVYTKRQLEFKWGQTLPAADGIEELAEKTKKQNKAKQKQTNKLGFKYIEKKKTVLSYLSVSLIKEEFQEACRKSQCHLLSTSSNRAQEPA